MKEQRGDERRRGRRMRIFGEKRRKKKSIQRGKSERKLESEMWRERGAESPAAMETGDAAGSHVREEGK